MPIFLLSTKHKHTNLSNFFNFKTCQLENPKEKKKNPFKNFPLGNFLTPWKPMIHITYFKSMQKKLKIFYTILTLSYNWCPYH
jgi:hypothetical protein